MAYISQRIVEDKEKIAIQPPSLEFGEAVRSNPELTQEYVDLSRRATDFLSSVLPQTPIVLAGNVTDYLYGDEAIRSNAKWDLGDVPVVTPPFKGVFLETASPGRFEDPDVRGWGAYFSRLDGAGGIESSEIPADKVKWTIEMALVYDNKGVLRTYPAIWLFYLDEEGQLLRDRQGDVLAETATLVASPKLEETLEGSKRWEDLKASVFTLALPFFWSFGFMHCRNVSLDPQAVSRQARRQAERRGTPVLDCRVLNIEPMRRVLAEEGRQSAVGLQRALHICRGHFKTYTEERPLFGKVAGTFWWEGSIRGSLTKGEVAKECKVSPPSSPSQLAP